MYLLYNTQAHGYLTKGGTYISRWADGRAFDRAEAIDLCKRHKTDAGYNLIPIEITILEELA